MKSTYEIIWSLESLADGCPKRGKNPSPKNHTSKYDKGAVRCCSKDGKTCITPKPCATTTWKKAHEICSLFGRRICKADDLKNNKCCLTGCYFDDKLTWQWNSVRRPSEEEHVPQGVLPPSGVVPGVGPPIHVEPFPPPELRPPPRPSSSQEEDSPPYRPPGAGPSEEENDHLPYHEDSLPTSTTSQFWNSSYTSTTQPPMATSRTDGLLS